MQNLGFSFVLLLILAISQGVKKFINYTNNVQT